MNLKQGVNGAFSMTSTVTDDWISYQSGSQGAAGTPLACKMTNETIINAKLHSDDAVDAYYKSRFKQVCEETDSTASDPATGNNTTTAAAGAGDPNAQQEAENIPETDMLFKITLEKCSDPSCSN